MKFSINRNWIIGNFYTANKYNNKSLNKVYKIYNVIKLKHPFYYEFINTPDKKILHYDISVQRFKNKRGLKVGMCIALFIFNEWNILGDKMESLQASKNYNVHTKFIMKACLFNSWYLFLGQYWIEMNEWDGNYCNIDGKFK